MIDAVSDLPSRRVLVVEDESAQRMMYEKALTKRGFGVQPAASVSEARESLGAEEFAVILLDLNLNGQSGMEFFEELRESHPATSVVIASGYGTLDAAARAIRMDVVDFLSKPVALEELEAAIERAWSRNVRLRAPMATLQPSQTDNDAHMLTMRRSLSIEQAERDLIFEALRRCQDNRKAAARMLGISERKLYYRLNLYLPDVDPR